MTKTVEEIAVEQHAKKQALRLIEEQLDKARTALAAAEKIASENDSEFEFEIGDGAGYFNGYMRNGEPDGYWSGWQGSNC